MKNGHTSFKKTQTYSYVQKLYNKAFYATSFSYKKQFKFQTLKFVSK